MQSRDIEYVYFSAHAKPGAVRLQYLLDRASRPLIWETNVQTDNSGTTSMVFQFRDQEPQALALSLDDWEELKERVELAQKNAGFWLDSDR